MTSYEITIRDIQEKIAALMTKNEKLRAEWESNRKFIAGLSQWFVELQKNQPNPLPINNEPPAQRTKNPDAVALGKLGGTKGGHARAASLSPEERQKIARNAANARWAERATKTLTPPAGQS